jgi:hypothetical protein
VIFEPGKTFISRHILHQHWYTCPIASPWHRNPQNRSPLTFVSVTSTPPFQPLCNWENFSTQLWTALCDKHFPPQTENISLWISFALSPFAHKEMHNRMLLFSSIFPNHGCHSDYWNQPLNMCMHICNLGCHEAGLCCHLVIHRENRLCPLQIFYFHLWPIYWLSLILLMVGNENIQRWSSYKWHNVHIKVQQKSVNRFRSY